MSLRDIFENKKALSTRSLASASANIETPAFVEVVNKDKNRYVPNVDYNFIERFAKFGLAEMYYEDSFNRVLTSYPFDGSGKEKQEWENESSDFDLFVFENLYPRYNGNVIFAPDSESSTSTVSGLVYSEISTPTYITAKGSMNTGSYQITTDANMIDLSKGFEYSNVYDESLNRSTNLRMLPLSGNTVEFWYKHNSTQISSASVLFDVWNGVATGSAHYGRFALEIAGSPTGTSDLYLTYLSGTTGWNKSLIASITGTTDWNHYAITIAQSGSYLNRKFYLNTEILEQTGSLLSLNEVTGSMVLNIGSLSENVGFGTFSGSMDEFRFWKSERTDEDISRFYFTNVNGGSNTDKAYLDLGVYFKFNEGITELSKYDNVVLDYSGRTSHGRITGNVTRNLGSAMVSASVATTEFKDPVIWKLSPTLSSSMESYKTIGRAYDIGRANAFYFKFPDFMLEEDDDGELRRLSQIVGSYFDNLLLYIKDLPYLKNTQYISGSQKPSPFADRKLMHKGIHTPEIFEDADELAHIYNRDEVRDFSDKLNNLKNTIYDNIYNNAVDILKAKGTEGSFRNILRCYGIGDDLVDIKYYYDNDYQVLEDLYKPKTVAKNFINFNLNEFTSYVQTDSIPYDENFQDTIQSFETEVVFPKKFDVSSRYFNNDYPYLSSSIFGVSSSAGEKFGVYLYAIREEINSPSVKFMLTSSAGSNLGAFPLELTSSAIEDIYDNSKWQFNISFKPVKRDVLETSGTFDTEYVVELIGKNVISDEVVNSISLSSSISSYVGLHLLTSSKYVQAGSNLGNYSDVKLGSLSIYVNEETTSSFDVRARDSYNYGNYETRVQQFSGSYAANKFRNVISHFEFNSVTGSNGSGAFTVYDIASGSQDGRYGVYDDVMNQIHNLNGVGFSATSTEFLDKLYIETSEVLRPDEASNNLVNIIPANQITYTQNSLPIKQSISLEKGPYSVVSREMMNFLGGLKSYGDVVFNNINRYSIKYTELENLRTLFFETISEDVDPNKFFEMYKWIDESVSIFIGQLIPASAVMENRISNTIESHVFERNKVWNKLPSLRFYNQNPTGTFLGVNNRTRTYQPSLPNSQDFNCFWWDNMFDPFNSQNTSNDSDLNLSRAQLLSSSKSQLELDDNRLLSVVIETGDFNKQATNNARVLINNNFIVSISSIKNVNNCGKVYFKLPFKINDFLGPKSFQPFYFVSSSASGGYIDHLHGVSVSAHINGLHDNFSDSIQSNYNKSYFGGYQHRNNAINETERVEAFSVDWSGGNISVTKTPNKINASRDMGYRGFVSTKNIIDVNYNFNYELVNGSSRSENNSWFRAYTGSLPVSAEVADLRDKKNNLNPEKSKSDSFFVIKFTSPGSLNETSDGYFDVYSGEYCVYSLMNYRNNTVRKGMNLSSSQHFILSDYV